MLAAGTRFSRIGFWGSALFPLPFFQFLSILLPSLTHTPYPAEGVEKDDDGVVLLRKGVLHPHIINHEVIIQCALSIEANSKNAFLLGFYNDVVFKFNCFFFVFKCQFVLISLSLSLSLCVLCMISFAESAAEAKS